MIRAVPLALLATPALAAVPPMDCSGTGPDWTLTLDTPVATFSDRTGDALLDVIRSHAAEGRDWPVALTLIGPSHGGVLIIDPLPEPAGTYSALILTQHGDTPILLAGTCTAKD